MNTTGIHKSAVVIFFAVSTAGMVAVPRPDGFIDPLLAAKQKLMSFGKHVLRDRAPELLAAFDRLPVCDTSDWRERAIVVLVDEGDSKVTVFGEISGRCLADKVSILQVLAPILPLRLSISSRLILQDGFFSSSLVGLALRRCNAVQCAGLAYDVLFRRRFSTPVPSRFREVWESGVELLLLSTWHDIILQVLHPQLAFGIAC